MFGASDCEVSMATLPAFATARHLLKASGIQFVEVDTKKVPEATGYFNITHLPTISFFYPHLTGGRKPDALCPMTTAPSLAPKYPWTGPDGTSCELRGWVEGELAQYDCDCSWSTAPGACDADGDDSFCRSHCCGLPSAPEPDCAKCIQGFIESGGCSAVFSGDGDAIETHVPPGCLPCGESQLVDTHLYTVCYAASHGGAAVAGAIAQGGVGNYSGLNGEQACEGHAYEPGACASVGCCEFDVSDGECWSAVGTSPCTGTDGVLTNPNSPVIAPTVECSRCVLQFDLAGGCVQWKLGFDPTKLIPVGCEDCGSAAYSYCFDTNSKPSAEYDPNDYPGTISGPPECVQGCGREPKNCAEFLAMSSQGGCASGCSHQVLLYFMLDLPDAPCENWESEYNIFVNGQHPPAASPTEILPSPEPDSRGVLATPPPDVLEPSVLPTNCGSIALGPSEITDGSDPMGFCFVTVGTAEDVTVECVSDSRSHACCNGGSTWTVSPGQTKCGSLQGDASTIAGHSVTCSISECDGSSGGYHFGPFFTVAPQQQAQQQAPQQQQAPPQQASPVTNGEELCEGHGYAKEQCAAVGCCQFAECPSGDGSGECHSNVGDGECVETPFDSHFEDLPTCTPVPSPISVHGDPMFKHNGTGTHFWIKEDVLTPLLLWRTADGLVMELSARTFNRPETGNQWIKQVVVAQNGTTVLDVSATTDDRQMRVKRPARAGKDVNIQVGEDNLVDIEANGVRFVVKPAQATKFYGHDTRHKYEHLDMQFPDGISAAAKPTGIFAQLAGVQPMLAATKELLVEPRLEVKQRKRMDERISRLAERESQLKKQLRRVAAKNPKAAKNTKPAKALNERQLQRLANSELKPGKKPHVMGRPAKQMRTLHTSRDVW